MPRCLRTAALGYLRAVLPRAALLVVCAAAAATAGCGGSGDPAVAHVAGREIKKSTLDDTVTHFRTEAKREGHDFPKPGTAEYRTAQRQLLRLLIARAELEAAAAREGVHATDAEAERRLKASSEADPGEGPDAFAVGTVRAQLVQERLSRKVTRGISVRPAAARAYYRAHRATYGRSSFASVAASIRSQLLALRKDEAMHAWLAAMHHRYDPTISYAKGYGP
jgi:SurA-like N-terminal domain